MHSYRCNFFGQGDGFEELRGCSAGEEGCGFARCDGEGGHGGVEFTGADGAVEGVRGDGIAGADVEPADLFVFAGCD